MANARNVVSIKMIADRLMRNPVLKDLNYEFIVDNAIELLRILDAPSIYVKMRERLNVVNYRSLKPITMMKVNSIARIDQGNITPLQSTDYVAQEFLHQGDIEPTRAENTFTLNSKYINLNFEKGEIDLIYETIAVDEECYPLVLDDATLLRCIESYIKYKWFDMLNDMDMISDRKLAKAEQDYMFNVGQADVNMKMPDDSELEAITNTITQILPSRTEFARRFEYLGGVERLRVH